MDDILPVIGILTPLIGLPWLILHYVTKWKTAPKITHEDEQLLDEMHQLSRRLEERLHTVERIISADNPDWRPGQAVQDDREAYRLDNREELRREREQFRRETRDPYRIERSN